MATFNNGADLIPIRELHPEWIDDYLGDGGELAHLEAYYPIDAPYPLRIVFSSLYQETVDQQIEDFEIALQVVGDIDGLRADNVPEIDAFVPEDVLDQFAELFVPYLSEDIESSDEYYVHLLATHPEVVLVTVEYLNEDQQYVQLDGKSPVYLRYGIVTTVNAYIVNMYRAKRQTGVWGDVTATIGSVTLAMWRWFWSRSNEEWQKRDRQYQTSIAGGAKDPSLELESPSSSRQWFDASVTGGGNDSKYRLDGYWGLGKDRFDWQ